MMLMPPLYGRSVRVVQYRAHPTIPRAAGFSRTPLYTLVVNIRVSLGVVAVSIAVALFATRLVAPGPADFYIESTTGMVLIAVRPGSLMMGSPESEPGLSRVGVPALAAGRPGSESENGRDGHCRDAAHPGRPLVPGLTCGECVHPGHAG